MTLPLPRPGPSNYQDEPGFELDLLWDQAADAIEATYAEVTAHLANTSNPHSVTKAQVGLGSVDNTADTNKPVSTAQAAADTAIGSAAASDATTKANSAQAAAIAACPAETATTIGALTAGATTKATPVDADVIGLSDSAASNVLKKLSWANIKAVLASVFSSFAAQIVPVLATPGYSTLSNATPIVGWGQKYTVPDSRFTFAFIRIRQLQQTAANSAEQWASIIFTVRATDRAGSIIATGTYSIPGAYSATISDVIVQLSATVTSALCGGVSYWVDYYAVNSAGTKVPCGRNQASSIGAALSNNVLDSAYYRQTNGTFLKTSSNPPVYYALNIEPCNTYALGPSNTDAGFNPTIVLPPMYGVVGRELNCYFQGLGVKNAKALDFDVTCAIGLQQAERFTHVAAAAATTAITIAVLNPTTQAQIATATSTITIVAAAAAGSPVLLCIGDSTTAAGTVTGELMTLDTADANIALTLVGTQGSAGNLHEGRSGWTAEQMAGSGSPLWFSGALNFSQYLSTNSLTTPTHVAINFGINDVFSAATDAAADTAIASCVTSLSAIVTAIQTYSAGIKIGVALTTPPSDIQDSFGANYACGQTRSQYQRNWSRLLPAVNAAFAGRTASLIYVLPYSISLDTANNMQTSSVAVNSRNSTTVTRMANGVHPAQSGYYQIADVLYAWLKCTLG
jgi:lysophospholipase L1-like esterase